MKYLITSLWIMQLILSGGNLLAQEQDSSILVTHKRLPILNGLRFMNSDYIRSPFIDTHVKFRLGSGEALDLKNYVKNLQGEVIDTLSGDLSYLSGELEFQYAVNDWLGFFLGYGGGARLGSNAFTILTSGIYYTTYLTLGGKVKLLENNNMLLSASLDYSSSDITLYSVYEYVKDVVESGKIDTTKSLMKVETINKTFINLNYAYSLTEYLGVQSVLGWGLGRTFDSKYRGNVRLSLAASMDFDTFKPLSFPVGILLGVKYNSYSENGENVTNLLTYMVNIGYTGHKDFDIGIETIYQKLDYINSDDIINGVLTSFKIQYYF